MLTNTFSLITAASGPVTELQCVGLQSHTADVTWLAPNKTNGNITGYLVKVALQNTGDCLYYIIIGQVVNLLSCF